MTGRDVFSKANKTIKMLVKILGVLPRSFRLYLFRKSRNISGKIGIGIRYILLKSVAKSCGDNVAIKEYVIINNPQELSLGNNISIHPFCYIESLGGITIGNDVSIAHNTSILSVNHTWEDKSQPIKYNEIKKSPVTLEDDVWVGCGCRIMAGTTVHRHSVIAAGAVVTKDIDSNTVVGGVPAKKLKDL